MEVSYYCKVPESILKTGLIRNRRESGNAVSCRGTAREKVRK